MKRKYSSVADMPLAKVKKMLKRNRAPKRRKARVKGAIAIYGGRQELKYSDIASTTYAGDTTGSVTALNLLAVGDDNTSRDGRQVCIKSVQLKGFVRPYDQATVTPQKGRLMLVWDNAVNSGSIATIAQILSASTANAFPLVDNANRFTILYDKSFCLAATNDAASSYAIGSPNILDINVYKKINQITQYSGTTAAIGSIQNGGLLMVTVGDKTATNGCTFEIASRIRFTDM